MQLGNWLSKYWSRMNLKGHILYTPCTKSKAKHFSVPDSFFAWQVYLPLWLRSTLVISSVATLFSKVIWWCSSSSSIFSSFIHDTDKGWAPPTMHWKNAVPFKMLVTFSSFLTKDAGSVVWDFVCCLEEKSWKGKRGKKGHKVILVTKLSPRDMFGACFLEDWPFKLSLVLQEQLPPSFDIIHWYSPTSETSQLVTLRVNTDSLVDMAYFLLLNISLLFFSHLTSNGGVPVTSHSSVASKPFTTSVGLSSRTNVGGSTNRNEGKVNSNLVRFWRENSPLPHHPSYGA